MATPKYIFTASNGQLVATLNNTGGDFERDEVLTYSASSPILYGNEILLFDFGKISKVFKIENIETINGVIPTNIENAQELLIDLIPPISSANYFKGDYNIITNTPTLSNATGVLNNEYKNTVAGTRDFGAGNITVGINDILAFNGTVWYLKVNNNQSGGVGLNDDFLLVNAFRNMYNY